MQKRPLGQSNLEVSALGFGCMSLTGAYGEVSEKDAIAVIHKALDLGINLFDTADIYGKGTNESLVGKAFKGRWNEVVITTKFGHVMGPEGRSIGVDARPENVRKSCEESLRHLGVDHVDLYYAHRIDPKTPVEETVGAMAELVKQGKVRNLGLSEASAKTLRRANAVHPITALQNEYSLWTRDIEATILPACRELGVSLVAYRPLGGGFLTGRIRKIEDLEGYELDDIPRYHNYFEENLASVKLVEEIAENKGCKASQVALAWVLAQGDDIVPLPGTKHIKYLEENILSLNVKLTESEKRKLDGIASSIIGERYSPAAMERVLGNQEWDM